MTKKRIITSTNDIEAYYQFCGPFSVNAKDKFGHDCELVIGYISNKDEFDPRYQRIGEFGKVVPFAPIEGISSGAQAKVTRMYLASQFEDDFTIIMDVDMFVVNESFFVEAFARCPQDKLGAIAGNVYFGGPDHGKFPMCYTHGMGRVFKKIINPKNLDYKDLLISWNKNYIDGKENIFNQFSNFSDESLLRALIHKAGMEKMVYHTHRPDVKCVNQFNARIDRGWWGWDQKKLEGGYYLDCNPLRPMNKNYDKMKGVLDFLNIDFEKVIIDV